MIALCSLLCLQVQQSQYSEFTLKGDLIAHQVEASLKGTQCELHADRVDADGTRHPRSFLKLGPAFTDKRYEFAIPDFVANLGFAGKVTYRVNDIRMQTIGMTSMTPEFVINSNLYSNGVALTGSHDSLGSSVVPGIKVDNIRLFIHIQPTVTPSGQISYEKPKAEFIANIDNTFIPRFSLGEHKVDIVDSLTHYKRSLATAVETQIVKALADPTRKAELCGKIQKAVEGQFGGDRGIASMRFQGTDLVIRIKKS